MSSAGTGIDNPKLSTYWRRYLNETVQDVQNTLDRLKDNHPSITQQEMDNIKAYISKSLQAQEFYDEEVCKENPYTVSKIKTGGMSRKMMEFVTSDRHAIGIYKRCVYDIEGMDSAVQKLKNMPHESKLTHKKQQLLNSYTKHYDRFQEDLGMLLKFDNVEGKLKEEFASSHDVTGRREWKQNLSDWQSPDYPKKPAYYEKTFNIYP